LIYAASERSEKMVQLLLEYGANPNVPRMDGKTPLMMAALWGRFENVLLLLKHGADKNAVDAAGLRAIDLATPSPKMDEYRMETAYLYDEPKSVDRQREYVVKELQPPKVHQQIVTSPITAAAFSKSESNNMIYHLAPTEAIAVRYMDKTVASLKRGPEFPEKHSRSGWGSSGPDIIDSEIWTKKVIDIAQQTGIVLQTHRYDRGLAGRFFACHAEKQLMAYFLEHHMFQQNEIQPWSDEHEHILSAFRPELQSGSFAPLPHELREFETAHELELADKNAALRGLYMMRPTVELKKATIVISSAPCEDCQNFRDRIFAVLGVDFTLQYRIVREC
jgi:hypothetical protein